MVSTDKEDGSTDPKKPILQKLPLISTSVFIGAFALFFVLFFRKDVSAFLNRTTKVSYGSFSIEAAEATLKRVPALSGASESAKAPPMSDAERTRVLSRFTTAIEELQGKKLLWVDDNPSNNSAIVDFLELYNMRVDVVRSTAEGLDRLAERSYDVVISDFNRPRDPVQNGTDDDGSPNPGAGAVLAAEVAKAPCPPNVVLFSSVGREVSAPPHVFSQTNRTFDLLNALLNGLASRDICESYVK